MGNQSDDESVRTITRSVYTLDSLAHYFEGPEVDEELASSLEDLINGPLATSRYPYPVGPGTESQYSLYSHPPLSSFDITNPSTSFNDSDGSQSVQELQSSKYLNATEDDTMTTMVEAQANETQFLPIPPTMGDLNVVYLPPPGYVYAELVAGRTIRLRTVAPESITWSPGQYFYVKTPLASRFGSRQFPTASICDQRRDTNEIVFVIRVKDDWSKDLWDELVALIKQRRAHPPGEIPPINTILPSRGALLRMHVNGPFGSVARVNWGHHSTAVIVVGGSGVSFGVSILEFLTLCMAGRDPRSLGSNTKGFKTSRVRFVWLVREYCECQSLEHFAFFY